MDELRTLLQGFIDSDLRLRIWRDYPDLSEVDDNYTEGWENGDISHLSYLDATNAKTAVIHGSQARQDAGSSTSL